jgi:hypothetical protein
MLRFKVSRQNSKSICPIDGCELCDAVPSSPLSEDTDPSSPPSLPADNVPCSYDGATSLVTGDPIHNAANVVVAMANKCGQQGQPHRVIVGSKEFKSLSVD